MCEWGAGDVLEQREPDDPVDAEFIRVMEMWAAYPHLRHLTCDAVAAYARWKVQHGYSPVP